MPVEIMADRSIWLSIFFPIVYGSKSHTAPFHVDANATRMLTSEWIMKVGSCQKNHIMISVTSEHTIIGFLDNRWLFMKQNWIYDGHAPHLLRQDDSVEMDVAPTTLLLFCYPCLKNPASDLELSSWKQFHIQIFQIRSWEKCLVFWWNVERLFLLPNSGKLAADSVSNWEGNWCKIIWLKNLLSTNSRHSPTLS